MTLSDADRAAIAARHSRIDPAWPDLCGYDEQERPCDAVTLLAALSDAQAERDALLPFAHHRGYCAKPGNYPAGASVRPCTCGFDDALALHRERSPAEEDPNVAALWAKAQALFDDLDPIMADLDILLRRARRANEGSAR